MKAHMQEPLRGVNLGGWLILEKWMTPSLFAGSQAIDEYTFMQTDAADEKLRQHHQTFIREEDFKWLSGNNIDAVRIPVGYWIFEGDEPYIGAIDRLDWAVKMATKYKLKVLIDLHGAKGSQNGQDHSGRIGKSDWYENAANQQATIATLERLAKRYYDQPAVWGIELLNEPLPGIIQWKLRKFYQQAYERLNAVARPGTMIVFSDAFRPRFFSGAIKSTANFPVAMDIHWYQFGESFQRLRNLTGYFHRLGRRPQLLKRLQKKQPVIIGEWSGVLTQYSLKDMDEPARQVATKQHLDEQLRVYSYAHAWFYWNYKTERRSIWNFRSLVEDGKIRLK